MRPALLPPTASTFTVTNSVYHGSVKHLAIGGDWAAAKGIDYAAMPQRIEVDYVRVWQTLHKERP